MQKQSFTEVSDSTSAGCLTLDGAALPLSTVVAHAFDPHSTVAISPAAWAKIQHACDYFDTIEKSDAACYGINTGFGDLITFKIDSSETEALQIRLILSHAVGMKAPLPVHISRTVFLLRLNCLSKGASGITPGFLKHLLALYNAGACPEIYAAGSLGASGDLGPLSHLAAFSIGEGFGYLHGVRMPAKEILARANLSTPVLRRKEGLSLINGTSALLATGLHAVHRLRLYLEISLVSMGMLIDALRIPHAYLSRAAFDLKPHPGACRIVEHLSALLADIPHSGSRDNDDLQPVYSYRCAPFILGPLVETLKSAEATLQTEVDSVSDNPLYVPGLDHPYHGGHFHGHPVSVCLDQLRVAAVHLSGILDRQLEFAFDRKRNPSVTPFLAANPGGSFCGLEGAQYLLTSLHAENVALANPFSCRTLPTNAGNQDYVSMGLQSALATLEMAENMKIAAGVHLLAALQAYRVMSRAPRTPAFEAAAAILSADISLPYQDNELMRSVLLKIVDDKKYIEALAATRATSTLFK